MRISAGQFELFETAVVQPAPGPALAPVRRKRVASAAPELPLAALPPPPVEPRPVEKVAEPATMLEPSVLSVSEVTRQIKGLLEGRFLRVAVTGEI
jgi:hypothetical protein